MKKRCKENNISFNIVTPKYFGPVQLSLLVLKSYIYSKNKDIPITLNSFYNEDATQTIVERILAQHPTVAAFSLYVWTEKEVVEICQQLKEHAPDLLILIGGNIPTSEGRYVLEQYPCFDIAMKGEGEETLYQLLEKMCQRDDDFSAIPNLVYRQDGTIVETETRENFNIEQTDYPILFDDFQEDEILFYETSRGCRYGCKYCAYNMNFDGKNVVRYYSNEKVTHDLKNIFSMPNVRKLDLSDSTIIGNRDRGLWLLKLFNQLNDERIAAKMVPIEIGVDVSLEDFDDEILYEVKRMHTFAYGFGLQSIDDEVLRHSSRRFDLKRFEHYFHELTKKSGAAVNLEIMFGLPGDSYEKFTKTLEYSISTLHAHFVVSFRFAVLPGSRFWTQKEKYQIVCEEHPPYNVITSPTFPKEDLERAEVLSFFLQLIYTLFRGIKRMIDKNFEGRKVPVYECLVEEFREHYADFFVFDNLRQGDVYEYISKLGTPEYADTKRSIQAHLRNALKQYQLEHCDQ